MGRGTSIQWVPSLVLIVILCGAVSTWRSSSFLVRNISSYDRFVPMEEEVVGKVLRARVPLSLKSNTAFRVIF